jgi:hypothetical protein
VELTVGQASEVQRRPETIAWSGKVLGAGVAHQARVDAYEQNVQTGLGDVVEHVPILGHCEN